MNVYVIAESPNGPCKVGFAADVRGRLSGLQNGNPRPLAIFHQERCEMYRTAERVAHSRLWARRMCGEWFDVPVSEAISAVRYGIEKALSAMVAREIARSRGEPPPPSWY